MPPTIVNRTLHEPKPLSKDKKNDTLLNDACNPAAGGMAAGANAIGDARVDGNAQTGTASVPGGIHDSDATPWDAVLKSLTLNLNRRMGKIEK